MDPRKLVAWNLRRFRVAKGLAQHELALDAEIDRTYVSMIELGRHNPSLMVLDRLAKALGVKIADLLEEPPPGAKAPAPLPKGRKPKPSRKRVKSRG